MSEREIPQALAREMEDIVRHVANNIEPSLIIASAIAITHQLDVLEQPEDPASVAGMDYEKCEANLNPCPGWAERDTTTASHVTYHACQAYAKREEAVKALSDHFNCLYTTGLPPSNRSHGEDLNARVRREFGWDK